MGTDGAYSAVRQRLYDSLQKKGALFESDDQGLQNEQELRESIKTRKKRGNQSGTSISNQGLIRSRFSSVDDRRGHDPVCDVAHTCGTHEGPS